MAYTPLFLFFIVVTKTSEASLASNRLLTPKSAHYPGDIYLGGLFPVMSKNLTTGGCTTLLSQFGLQQLEAMMFAVEQINNDSSILPGFKLGAIALDTCGSDKAGNLAALKLMLLDDLKGQGNNARLDLKNKMIVGVVGPNYDSVAASTGDLYSLFHIPQISYGATSSLLSNSHRFTHFFRNVPSEIHLTHSLARVINHHRWSAIGVLYQHTHYGTKWFQRFEIETKRHEICISQSYWVDVNKLNDVNGYRDILKKFRLSQGMNVIVSQIPFEFHLRLLDAVSLEGLNERFVFITTDWWDINSIPSEYYPTLEGTLAVVPELRRLRGFRDFYHNSIYSAGYYRNAWAEEVKKQFRYECEENEEIESRCEMSLSDVKRRFNTSEFGSLHYVKDAVWSFAMALRKYHKEKCGSAVGICHDMKESLETMGIFPLQFQRILRTQDCGESGCFVNGTDGQPNISVMNFQSAINPRWVEVGKFTGKLIRTAVSDNQFFEGSVKYIWVVNGSLQYKQITEEKFKLNSNSYPSSQCGSPCAKHEVMVHLTQDKCCHSCSPCTTFPWVKHSETVCHLCKHEDFLQPNANRTDCELAPSTYFGLHEVLGVLIMVLAIAGFLCALLTLFLFFRYINTPIIKASGRELSLITLMGVLLGYLTTLFLIVPPSLSVCVFVRFFYGLSYVMCYAAILTKANRIMRIFHRNSASQTKVRYISPMSQILIVLLLVTFQGVINTIWLILRPPTVQLKSDLDVDKQQVQVYTYCGAFSDENMVITLLFPAVLLLFCLFYAFKTRKVPGAFSEAKPIFVAVYTTSVLWLAFIPVFFTIQLMSIRIFVLAMAKIVNATVTLVCMFGPKLHLALFHPEKNNKETILGRRNTRTHVDLGDTDPTDAPNTFGRSRLDQSRPSETPLLKMN